jgi:methionyl-tRNA formyltransferase
VTPLNIVFAGTPEFAADHLQALLDSSHNVIGVYTQPDRPAGRGKKLTPSAVKTLALQHEIPVYQPNDFKSQESLDELNALNADVMVVVAYGLILPKIVLDIPRFGCLNVHGSLLPRWRGAAPIQRAIWAGDETTGVTIMQMDEGLDTGAMLYQTHCSIDASETSATLYNKLAEQGPEAIVHVLNQLHSLPATPQDNALANYAKKLSKEEALINWQLPADQLEKNVRAFNPWPVAFFHCAGNAIKVWAAHVEKSSANVSPGTILSADKTGLVVQTGQNALRITQCQIPNKKAMAFADVYNARKDWFTPGIVL